jgi:ABC-type molybdate transport system substrate-binding protein
MTMTPAYKMAVLAVAALGLAGCSTGKPPAAAAETPVAEAAAVSVYAAGSLRAVLTTLASAHEARTGQKIALMFGASGLLRERIEKGEGAQVFASADTDNPRRLAHQGGWHAPTVFARNALCALTSETINATPATLLATMLNPKVRLGTSMPGDDPAGDYAWALFRQAEAVQQGAYFALNAKALKLTGGADSPKAPAGRGTYAWIMDQGQADVFLTYCTNAVAAQKEVPRLKVVQLPHQLQVGVTYGLTVRHGAPQAAADFAQSLLAPPAQAVFRQLGFGAP